MDVEMDRLRDEWVTIARPLGMDLPLRQEWDEMEKVTRKSFQLVVKSMHLPAGRTGKAQSQEKVAHVNFPTFLSEPNLWWLEGERLPSIYLNALSLVGEPKAPPISASPALRYEARATPGLFTWVLEIKSSCL